MAGTDTAPKETPEQIKAREAQQRELTQSAQSADQGILGMIMGFLKFFFESFLTGKEAPNETPGEKPDTPVETLRMGQSIVQANVIPKWKAYQEAHKGEAVVFKSPVLGKSQITSGFGHRDTGIEGASTNHAGVDVGARGGDSTPDILASAGGITLFSGQKSGYGNAVIIGHANGISTLYGHMSATNMPALGAEVAQGQKIGVMGRSGLSDGGIHLHYEQRRGDQAIQPKIAGVALTKGAMMASGDPADSSKFAGLVNPDTLPKLATSTQSKPAAPTFKVASSTIGAVHVH
ncbi:MAG: M23 family metallopeptidase [Pseudomonadota bacterium]